MGFWRSKQAERDMQEEMRLHIEMEAERLSRVDGLDAQEARRQAGIRFGGVEKYKEEGREARGFYWLDSLSLDARLGLRMLGKNRWLTLVGGFAMAVAIAIGAITFEIIGDLLNPALPFPGGDRVVALRYVAPKSGGTEDRVFHAFTAWRERSTTLEHVGALRIIQHNLVMPNTPPEPIRVAETTAAAFEITQTPPMLGRYLQAADEALTAPYVVVIGYDAWRVRFNADPQIVGRSIQLGPWHFTIVGVMPAGYRFPYDDQFWTPLRLDPLRYAAWQGPSLEPFARLKPGVSMEQAQAELASASRSIAEQHPDGAENLRTLVVPFTRGNDNVADSTFVLMLRAARVLVAGLTFVVAVNLAILLYARTVTRLGEIAVRTALGASRRRILSQLFIEALALTGIGAVAGLLLAAFVLDRIEALGTGMPFWIQYELTASSILFGLMLALVAAFIMGVLPGMKVTGARLSANLQELNGRAATRLGAVWTTLIVAQVAVAAAVLPVAAFLSWHIVKVEMTPPSIAVEQIVVADMVDTRLSISDQGEYDRQQVRDRITALTARLMEEPGVAAVTFSSNLPGYGPDRRIELSTPGGEQPEVAVFRVDVDLLTVYGTRMVAGRGFDDRDIGSRAVVVNRTFATDVLGVAPEAALGSRFRYAQTPDWLDVVGVVEDFPGFPRDPGSETEPTAYQPAAAGDFAGPVMSLRFSGPVPSDISERLRTAGAQVDPDLQLRRILPLANLDKELRSLWRNMAWALGIITLSVLLLSAAGMHALMSFTIAQRTREIGIRAALGAQPRQLLRGLFARAMRQLAIGLVIGSLVSVGIFAAIGIDLGPAIAMLVTVATVMAIVASFAAVGPARRTLRMPAVEALRVEG